MASKQVIMFSGEDIPEVYDGQGVRGLWISDGTAAGTYRLKGINGANPAASINPSEFASAGGKVFFAGVDRYGHQALWVTDGTAAGTVEIGGIANAEIPGVRYDQGGFRPVELTPFGDKVVFRGWDSSGKQSLWISDGGVAGTTEIGGLGNAGVAGANSFYGLQPGDFVVYNGKVFFNGLGGTYEQPLRGLWSTDGTAAGTTEIIAGLSVGALTVFDGKLFFAGLNASGKSGLWASDGTAAGTHEITGIAGVNIEGLHPIEFTVAGGKLFFRGFGSNFEWGLWVSDGTAAGTHAITGVAGVYTGNYGLNPEGITAYGDKVLFTGLDSSGNSGLWISDGTTAGTVEIGGAKSAGVIGADSIGLDPYSLVVLDGKSFFAGRSNSRVDLWATDGSAAGTRAAYELPGGSLGPLFSTVVSIDSSKFEARAADDFDASGKSDLLLQNESGDVVTGEIVDGQLSYTRIAALGSEWSFGGNGVFLVYGAESFLVKNENGAIVVGEAKNGAATYTEVGALGQEWTFVGTGNFYGAGPDQFLIENKAGAVVVGDVRNDGQAHYAQVAALGDEWDFVGTGDFLGDGRDEFLIENNQGAIVVGEVTNGAASYTQIGALGSEWQFVGAGDFLGTGHDQFLIRNTSGAVVIGDVQNGQASYSQVSALGLEWSFIGAGDYLGTGTAGFVIKNTSGEVFLGTIADGQASYAQIGGLGSEWSSRG